MFGHLCLTDYWQERDKGLGIDQPFDQRWCECVARGIMRQEESVGADSHFAGTRCFE
jgi:hypothetical protein